MGLSINDIIDRLRDSHRRRISKGYEFDKSINLLEQELKNNNIQENYISIIIEW